MHHTCHKSAPELVRRRGGFQARNPPLRARIYHTPFYTINTKMPAVEKKYTLERGKDRAFFIQVADFVLRTSRICNPFFAYMAAIFYLIPYRR